MTFRVGQKVVCVDATFIGRTPPNLPRLNGIYTLRDSFSADGWTWWRLVEIVNPPSAVYGGRYGIMEPAFAPSRFRPVVSRQTSIEIFTAMLNPSKQGVDA